MSIHDPDCTCTGFSCVIRRGGGLQVSPKATPSRHNRKATKTQPSAWNAQVRGEARPGGFVMPYLNPDGAPVRAKQWESEHRKITDNVARTRAHHARVAEGS